MKLLTLELLAYGVFSDRTLDFGAHKTGFHVVFGGNEAGKSTSLRALLALLYGVPGRTQDNFLHENAKLRVGGRLRHSSGKELEFRRRKGNKNTLVDLAEAAIDDGSLHEFLAGVDRARFEAVFGIDHERLAKGAQAILSGGGGVGESLFSAGVGTANLREVLDRLDAEADELYKSRGSKPKINDALAAYKTSAKKVREATLLSSGWTKQRKHLEKLHEQQRDIATQQGELTKSATRLQRLQKVLPKLAQRDALLTELQTLDEVETLPEDFAERRRTAEQTLRQIEKTRGDAERELKINLDEVAGLDVPAGLIEEHAAVNTLYKHLGSFRKAQEDGNKLEARRKQARADAHGLLDELRPEVALDDVDEIRPKTSTKARVRELAQQFQAIDAAPTHENRNVKRCERELKTDQQALAALDEQRQVALLRQLVARHRKRGELEATHQNKVSGLADAEEAATLALRGLVGWTGTLEECEGLAVPANETIDSYKDKIAACEKAASDFAAAIKKCEASLADKNETVKALELAGTVMTEADLQLARERRTQYWLRIRRVWLGESAPAGADEAEQPGADLPASYEVRVDEADEVADRLRREAERVATFAELEATRMRLAAELHQLRLDRGEVVALGEHVAADWAQIWAPLAVTPLSPREMRSWLTAHKGVVELAKGVREATRRVHGQQRDIDALRDELSSALRAIGESALGEHETLAAGLDRADLVVDAVTETTRRRAELLQGIPTRKKALDDARDIEDEAVAALAAWRIEWEGAVSDLGLEASASPTQANAVLDKLIELFEKVDEARGYKGRLTGIARDDEEFTAQVVGLVQRAAPDLLDRPTDQAVEVLHERLASAQADAATLRQLDKRIKELHVTIANSNAEGKLAEVDLDALCAKAGCEQPADLPAAERKSGHKAELRRKLVQVEEQITEMGGGAAVEALVGEAKAIDSDALPGQIEELGRNTTALDEHRSGLDKQIGSEESEFRRLNGSDAAADEAATAQAELARLGTDIDRYVRVKLAAELLRAEIERYRKENQGPVLKRAGEIFSVLTLGSFTELGADYNDKDEPVLVGVRANEERVHVEGMSDGTADQLYLSIRLATLEQHLATHEPIPFVVDDILVHFDDDRAYAALQVLADLSKKTQVLFFTHHARLVELARKLGDGVAAVHQL